MRMDEQEYQGAILLGQRRARQRTLLEAVLTVLAVRDLEVDAAARARLEAADSETLIRWLGLAVSAVSVEEILAR